MSRKAVLECYGQVMPPALCHSLSILYICFSIAAMDTSCAHKSTLVSAPKQTDVFLHSALCPSLTQQEIVWPICKHRARIWESSCPTEWPSNNGSSGQILLSFGFSRSTSWRCTLFKATSCGIKPTWPMLVIFQSYPLCSLTLASWDELQHPKLCLGLCFGKPILNTLHSLDT